MDDALEITHIERNTGLSLAGELDLHTAPQLNEAFAGLEKNGQVTLDLSELTFIDSSGLHAIVECACAAEGGPLVLEGATAMMRRIFEVTNLADHSKIEIRSTDG